MILIGIRCDAGPGTDGKPRKVTVLINADGELQGVRLGWPDPKDTDLCEGPILRITPEEYLLQCQIQCGEV
jgi:hypothetical protein